MIRTKQIGQALKGLFSPVLKRRGIKITVEHVPAGFNQIIDPLFRKHLSPLVSPPGGAQLSGRPGIVPFETLTQTPSPSFSSLNYLLWTPNRFNLKSKHFLCQHLLKKDKTINYL